VIIRNFYVKSKKFNDHSNDVITFCINKCNNCVRIYPFRHYYSANLELYLLGKFNFLGNVQIFFIGA
jgi:hypothetical protein